MRHSSFSWGVQPGRVVGADDAQAASVHGAEYKLANLGKTMYHLLGIDPDQELRTTDNRPSKLMTATASGWQYSRPPENR